MEGAKVAKETSSPRLVGDSDLLIVGPGVLGRLVAEEWRKVQFYGLSDPCYLGQLRTIGSYALFGRSSCQDSLFLIWRGVREWVGRLHLLVCHCDSKCGY